ncbi:MAG: hypothetical protein KC910_09710 [Candidatus Eremiobacteraeota bacterium]|nr:hypothetical protein [Candidatus Eremiobacteraeota bacterium]
MRWVMLLSILLLSPAWAERAELSEDSYVVGVLTEKYEAFADPDHQGQAQESNWGWAAAMQQILNFHGLKVNQRDLIERTLGAAENETADLSQILAKVPGSYPDSRGRSSTVHLAVSDELEPVWKDLENDWPALVGIRSPGVEFSEAHVLTSATFKAGKLVKVGLRNPVTTGKVDMDGDDFRQRATIIRVYVDRE